MWNRTLLIFPLPVAILSTAMVLGACGGDDRDPCDFGQTDQVWYPLGGSEFLQHSERVPLEYVDTESQICHDGVGPGSLLAFASFGEGGFAALGNGSGGATGAPWIAIWNGNAWTTYQLDHATNGVTMAVGPNGDLAVGWRDSQAQTTTVSFFDGAAWTELPLRFDARIVGAPLSALDAEGRPVRVWTAEEAGIDQVFVARYEASGWVGLAESLSPGGLSASASYSTEPKISVSSAGVITVLWSEWLQPDIGEVLYLRQFDGGSWIELSGSATGLGLMADYVPVSGPSASYSVISTVRLTLDNSELPLVAWNDCRDGECWFAIADYDGSSWSHTQIPRPAQLVQFSVTVDRDNNPTFAWHTDGDIYLNQWRGGVWSEINGSGTGGGVSNSARGLGPSREVVAANVNAVCVAWNQAEPYVCVEEDECEPGTPFMSGPVAIRVLVRCSDY